jgi:hypothetical protein
MLKFGFGVVVGLTLYGLALSKIMHDEELWNKFIESVDTHMGYGVTLDTEAEHDPTQDDALDAVLRQVANGMGKGTRTGF